MNRDSVWALAAPLLFAGCGLLFAGCGEKIDALQETACSQTLGQVTYVEEIEPIIERLCAGCHSSALTGSARNGAPPSVDLDSYQSLVTWVADANALVQNGTMPPGEPKASPADKELLSCWIEGGMEQAP